jgi:hypothetical protein
MKVPGITCKVCGSDELVAVEPGADVVYAPLSPSLPTTGVVIGKIDVPARNDVGWCRRCWPWPIQGYLFAESRAP